MNTIVKHRKTSQPDRKEQKLAIINDDHKKTSHAVATDLEHVRLVKNLTKKIKELRAFATLHIEKNRELNEELKRQKRKVSSLKQEQDDHRKLLGPIVEEYTAAELLELAKKLNMSPHKLWELAYTPSDVIAILKLNHHVEKDESRKITSNQVIQLAEKHELFKNPFKVKRLYRLRSRSEKYTSTVFFSLLGVLEFYYWYHWNQELQESLKSIWKEHKADFLYLAKR